VSIVTIVDTRTGKLMPGMSILTGARKILAIVPSDKMIRDASIPVIDAAGKFALPGYNDMHVHLLDQENSSALLALMLTRGITGIRQMSGSSELLEQRRNETLPIDSTSAPGNARKRLNSLQCRIREFRRCIDRTAEGGRSGFYQGSIGEPGGILRAIDAGEASNAGFKTIEHLGPEIRFGLHAQPMRPDYWRRGVFRLRAGE
jgi:hypothetical protein